MVAGVSAPAHIDIVRFPIACIPQDPKALSDWVMQRFARKEKLIDCLKKNGRFPTVEYEEPLDFLPQEFERRPVIKTKDAKL
jgi:hypothetical protein